MKRFLLFAFALLLIAGGASAQLRIDSLPYQRFPDLPPLQLLLGDSSTMLTKEMLRPKKPTLIIYFSPSCSHCQHSTEELVKYKDSLPDMNLVMATFASVSEMNYFREHYHTDSLPYMYVGKDVAFLLPSFYGIANLPFLAFYDRNGKLAQIFDGSMSVPKILAQIRTLDKGKK